MFIAMQPRHLVAAFLCGMATLVPAQVRAQTDSAAHSHAAARVVVYKNPACGCCNNWVEHVRHHGFLVDTHDETDMQALKAEHAVPAQLASCHTAVVEGYVIEGHVPADVIARLLSERPDVAGLAVPGMPIGSPGMEMEGREPRPYDIIAFTRDGKTSVFAQR